MSIDLATGNQKKQKQLGSLIEYVLCSLQGTGVKDEDEEFLRTISIAKQEMLDAQSYFDNVTDPELVDHAIYKMEATKAQYVYLLRLAKDKGLRVNIQSIPTSIHATGCRSICDMSYSVDKIWIKSVIKCEKLNINKKTII